MGKEIVLPKILTAGVYDAQSVYGNTGESKKRRVGVFETELIMTDGGVSFIDNDSYPIKAGGLICVRPGQVRRTRLPFKCFYIHFTLDGGSILDMLSGVQNYIEIKEYEKYESIFREISQAFESSSDGDKLLMQSRMLELIYMIYNDNRSISHTAAELNENIKKALIYMDKHSLENISLGEIAENVNLSRTYFHSLFTKAVGITPQKYLLQKKITAARNKLLYGSQSVSEIAFETGFSSQSYFNYVFKKETGTTPQKYRKLMYEKYRL